MRYLVVPSKTSAADGSRPLIPTDFRPDAKPNDRPRVQLPPRRPPVSVEPVCPWSAGGYR